MDSSDVDMDELVPNLVELNAILQLPPELANVSEIPLDFEPGTWFIYHFAFNFCAVREL